MATVVEMYSRISTHLRAPPQSHAYSPPSPLEGVQASRCHATSWTAISTAHKLPLRPFALYRSTASWRPLRASILQRRSRSPTSTVVPSNLRACLTTTRSSECLPTSTRRMRVSARDQSWKLGVDASTFPSTPEPLHPSPASYTMTILLNALRIYPPRPTAQTHYSVASTNDGSREGRPSTSPRSRTSKRPIQHGVLSDNLSYRHPRERLQTMALPLLMACCAC